MIDNRILTALALGLTISLGLFWLMQAMIMNNQQGFEKTKPLHMVDFIRLKRESELNTKDRTKHEKPPEKRPPPPKMEMHQAQVNKAVPKMDMPNLNVPLQSNRFSGSLLSGLQIGAGNISTNVIPLVRIPPRYPMRAATRRIEGWVKVEFTITKIGTVKDAVVVDAQPKHTFDQAALRAIRRWKFKAKVIDGDAFEQRAMQILQFKLSR